MSASPLWTHGELAEMAAISEANLPDRCVIEAVTRTTAAGGRVTEAWNPRGAAVPCRLSPAGDAVAASLADQPQALARWIVVLPQGTVVAEGDRLQCSGTDIRGAPWTRTLIVVDERGDRTFEVMRKVVANDVGAGGR